MEPISEQRLKDIIYNLVSIYLGIDFILWGISNFTSDDDFDTRFGYPSWIQIPIGISETLAGKRKKFLQIIKCGCRFGQGFIVKGDL